MPLGVVAGLVFNTSQNQMMMKFSVSGGRKMKGVSIPMFGVRHDRGGLETNSCR
jgi:hypothetical protein